MNVLASVDKRLWWIMALAAFFIFFRISHVDMVGDDAHYSVRAIGPIDFLFGNASFQSTPVQWFAPLPWWAHLSFHDHPALLFWIQHVFLSVHESVWFAKLPSALMLLGSVFLIYQWVKQLFDNASALIAALLFTLHAHVLWAGRVAYLESGVIFFTVLSWYTLVRFVKDPSRWWQWGIATGLALSVKLTTLFLVPTTLVFLALQHRAVFKQKECMGGAAIVVIFLLPILFYNALLYASVGHFSLQFARLFGQGPWHLSGARVDGFGGAAVHLLQNLALLMSWPYFFVWILAIVFCMRFLRRAALLPLLGTLFLGIQQIFIGENGYVLAPFGMFAAATVAMAGVEAYRLSSAFPLFPSLFRWGSVAFFAYLTLFVVNSHVLVRHRGPVGWARASVTSNNEGMMQLDRYLDSVLSKNPQMGVYDIYWQIKRNDPWLTRYAFAGDPEAIEALRHGASVVLYDGNISWFARVWLFERRRFYHNAPMISLNEEHLLKDIHIRDMVFIRATDAAPLDAPHYRNARADVLEAELVQRGAVPTEIRRDDGSVAFRVYQATL